MEQYALRERDQGRAGPLRGGRVGRSRAVTITITITLDGFRAVRIGIRGAAIPSLQCINIIMRTIIILAVRQSL